MTSQDVGEGAGNAGSEIQVRAGASRARARVEGEGNRLQRRAEKKIILTTTWVSTKLVSKTEQGISRLSSEEIDTRVTGKRCKVLLKTLNYVGRLRATGNWEKVLGPKQPWK